MTTLNKIVATIFKPVNWLEKQIGKLVPYDKFKHFIYGMGIAGISIMLYSWFWSIDSFFEKFLAGFTLVVVFGFGKEARDKITGKGTPEWWDIWATLIGGFIVSILYQL